MWQKRFVIICITALLFLLSVSCFTDTHYKNHQKKLIAFLKNSEIAEEIITTETEWRFGGATISLMDLTGDGIPEVIIYWLHSFMAQAAGDAKAYDLHSCKKLLDFHISSPSANSIKAYHDEAGNYVCLAVENLFKISGRTDTVITEIRTCDGILEAKTRFLFNCVGFELETHYFVYRDLTPAEDLAYREKPFLDPTSPTAPMSSSVYEVFEYMNSLTPQQDILWEQVGAFFNFQDDILTMKSEPGYEVIAEAINNFYTDLQKTRGT